MPASLPVWVSIVAGIISGIAAALITSAAKVHELKNQYRLQDASVRVARALLKSDQWPIRSFDVLRHHLGGFPDNELRQILVRSGAIRFMSKSGFELWGLLERNKHLLGHTQIDKDPVNQDSKSVFGPA
jgi:hypothetical protein